jgi:ferric-dicitrate binding protein FerR (iron transport regulator)
LYKKNRLTEEEKKLLEDWFQQLDHGTETPLNVADKDRLKNNILSKIKPSTKTVSFDQGESIHESSRYTWWMVAASASIVFLVGFLVWRFAFTPAELKTFASNGTVTKVTLADGSLVWLKGESFLQAPSTFSDNTRNVILQGEALFEVAKDAQHPFVIQCGEITTTVLGTSFNIKSLRNSIELTVLTGKVSLTSDHDAKGTIVLPNEKVIYDAEKALMSSQKIVSEERVATTDGTEYEMHFNDVSLDTVFNRIEKKFDVKIFLSSEGLRNCKIRADFSDQSLENTLNMISQALNFRYTIQDKEVRLTGDECR